MRVLLIEDNDDDVALLREDLSTDTELGVLDHAASLGAGLQCLDAGTYDVVLLDLGLPDSSGIETLSRLHAHSPGVPIVVLTGTDDESLALRAVKQGVQDFLTKGQFDQRRLAQAVHYAVERHRLQLELETQRAQVEEEMHRAEEARQRRIYLEMGERAPASVGAAVSEGELLDILPAYQEFIVSGVRSVHAGGKRPHGEARDIQVRLYEVGAGANQLVRIHLLALDRLTGKVRADWRTTLASVARLGLVEVMGLLLEAYRADAQRGSG